MEKLVNAIRELGNFSTNEISLILSKVKRRTLTKNEFLLKEGHVCCTIWFVNEGSVRQYCTNDLDTEITMNLFVENDWLMDYSSFIAQKPSGNNIQAFEDCEVFELSIFALHELFEYSSKYLLIGKLLQNVSQTVQLNGHFFSPEEKYREILINKPVLLKKFPLNFIASYLGMAPETLSRVRRRIKMQAQ